MEDRKEKDKLNDELLGKVSGGDEGSLSPSSCIMFRDCPYSYPCMSGLPCPKSTDIEFDPDTRDL